MVALSLTVGLVPACSGTPDGSVAPPSSVKAMVTTTSTTSTTLPPALPISSRFPAATSEGYTFNIEIKVAVTGAILDVASAKPGKAHVIPRATGHLTITNTTPSRKAVLSVAEGPSISLLWPKADLEARFGKQHQGCFLEFRGITYCLLATVRLKVVTPTASFGVGESVTLPIPDAGTPGLSDSHDEPIARWVVDQLNSHQPPKLLIVEGLDSRLMRSCVAGFWKPIAILDGTGSPLLTQGTTWPHPECSKV
jgi:hypothetical protein